MATITSASSGEAKTGPVPGLSDLDGPPRLAAEEVVVVMAEGCVP